MRCRRSSRMAISSCAKTLKRPSRFDAGSKKSSVVGWVSSPLVRYPSPHTTSVAGGAEMVLDVDVEGIANLADLTGNRARGAVVIRQSLYLGTVVQPVRPAGEEVASVKSGIGTVEKTGAAGVEIALDGQVVGGRERAIGAEST